MQHDKICSRPKAQLTRFSLEVTVGLSKPLRNFVGEMLLGIPSQPGREAGQQTEDRLSHLTLQRPPQFHHRRLGLFHLNGSLTRSFEMYREETAPRSTIFADLGLPNVRMPTRKRAQLAD
jgi:hypothetical protein